MSVTSLGQLVGGGQRNIYQLNERARNAIAEIGQTADNRVTLRGEQDSTTISAQQFQARADGFREVAQEIAKNVSELATALRNFEKFSTQLGDLEQLAAATLESPFDDKVAAKLNTAVKKVRAEIDKGAQNSSLAAVDDGVTPEATKNEPALPKITSAALLGDEKEITSVSDVRNLISTVQNAAGKLATIQSDIKSTLESYDVMATHIEVSVQNQMAANSLFPADDELNALEMLLGQPNQAAAAQGGNLPGNLLLSLL